MWSLALYLHLEIYSFFFNYKLTKSEFECTIYYLSQAAHCSYKNVQKWQY